MIHVLMRKSDESLLNELKLNSKNAKVKEADNYRQTNF